MRPTMPFIIKFHLYKEIVNKGQLMKIAGSFGMEEAHMLYESLPIFWNFYYLPFKKIKLIFHNFQGQTS